MLVTNSKDYVTLNPDDDDAIFRYGYENVMIAQFIQDIYNKNSSLQDQGKGHQIDTLQNRINFSHCFFYDTGGPIPDDN